MLRPLAKEYDLSMDRVPLLYFEIMAYFQKFKAKNHENEAGSTGDELGT